MYKSKPFFGVLTLCMFFILCCKQQTVYSQKIRVYDLVKDFNAVPDDKTDNYLAFVKAAETLSRAGGGQLNIPKGKYYIAGFKSDKSNKAYKASDIVFKDCNNLTIIGNNSVIRVNGNFSRNPDYQIPGYGHFYAFNNTVCPFKIMNCKNVLLKDITLYGEVDKMRRQNNVVEGENYGVFISDDEPNQKSSRILLQNVTAHHFAADGFLIKSNGNNIVMDRCYAYKNARQGLSIVKGRDIKVINSTFDSTGVTGKYGWHAPGAGIDVENEFGKDKLTNVSIRNCNLRGNNGFQIVTTLPSENIIIDSCFISDSKAGYSENLTGVGMYSLNSTISNCIIFGNIQVDIADQGYIGPIVQQIYKNIIYSGTRAIVSSDFSRPVNITDNILIMLPKPSVGDYFPYIQNPNCRFNNNIIVYHADKLKKDPNLVSGLVQNANESINDFWLTNGYEIPFTKQAATSYMIAMNGTKTVKDHFFAPSDIVARYNFNRTIFLTNAQVHAILSTELFMAYKQKAFSRKYILQAKAVREYTRNIVAAAGRK